MLQARKRWIALCAVCACALVVPTLAEAADLRWELVADPAPGATGLDGSPYPPPPRIAFTVANGTPYLAEITRSPDFDLTVYRTIQNWTWRQLGAGPLNDPGLQAGSTDFATAGDAVWLAWDEGSGNGQSVTHVVRLTGSGVRELPGSPIAGASSPQIAYFGGRLYVAFAGNDGMHALRTRSNGRGFERVESFDHTPAVPLEMGVYRGRLYLSDFESNTTLYSALNRRQTGWFQVDDPPEDLFAQRIGETVFTLGGAGGGGPGAPNFVRVFATRRGVTQELPSPATLGNNVIAPKLLVSNGVVWMQWTEGGPSDMAPPFVPHVARLIKR
jgi:hypothetical protein